MYELKSQIHGDGEEEELLPFGIVYFIYNRYSMYKTNIKSAHAKRKEKKSVFGKVDIEI